MRDKSTVPVISPDGRFEVIIEDDYDRGIFSYNTVLIERATGKQLFTCDGSHRAEFAGDGMLTIHYPGYEPRGVEIDPVKRAFRTHPSEPWVPAAAWRIVESAYRSGWAQGINYKPQSQPTPFPWVTIILLFSSIVALPALGMQTFLSSAKCATLMVIAAIGVLFFGWLTASDFRPWMQEKNRTRSPGGLSRSSRSG